MFGSMSITEPQANLKSLVLEAYRELLLLM